MKCGKKFPVNTSYCNVCGASLAEDNNGTLASRAAAAKGQSNRRMFSIVILVAIIAAVATTAWHVVGFRSDVMADSVIVYDYDAPVYFENGVDPALIGKWTLVRCDSGNRARSIELLYDGTFISEHVTRRWGSNRNRVTLRTGTWRVLADGRLIINPSDISGLWVYDYEVSGSILTRTDVHNGWNVTSVRLDD